MKNNDQKSPSPGHGEATMQTTNSTVQDERRPNPSGSVEAMEFEEMQLREKHIRFLKITRASIVKSLKQNTADIERRGGRLTAGESYHTCPEWHQIITDPGMDVYPSKAITDVYKERDDLAAENAILIRKLDALHAKAARAKKAGKKKGRSKK